MFLNPELYCKLLNDYLNLLTFNAPALNAATDVCHVIKMHGEPVRSKVHILSPEMLEVAKKEIDRLLEAKTIQCETSPWDLPIHLAKKKATWSKSFNGRFSALNAITEHNSYPLSYLNDFTNLLHGCKIISLTDFKNAFHHVPINPNSVTKACTVTPSLDLLHGNTYRLVCVTQPNVSRDT